MFNRRKASALAVAAVTAALGLVPAAGTAQAATCTWQKTAWDLPANATSGTLYASDGARYGVGVTGTLSPYWPYDYKVRYSTLWDNGKVVLQLPESGPKMSDVNASGVVVGTQIINNKFTAVTVSRTGAATVLPTSPTWDSSGASVINNRGDIAGSASIGLKHIVVVWPASAPGTYREIPVPSDSYLSIADIDEQGDVVGSTLANGFVANLSGQWHTLAAQGTNAQSTPMAVRDGRIVGSMDSSTSYAAAEWNTQGSLVRTIKNGAVEAKAIGGLGTVGGSAFVNSTQRSVLWRDGVVSDPLTAVSTSFAIDAISNDEKTLIGNDVSRPAQYTCS